MLQIELKVTLMLSTCSTTELHPKPDGAYLGVLVLLEVRVHFILVEKTFWFR